MSIRGVVFDLDGTLANTVPICLEALRRTFLHYAARCYGDNEIRPMFGPTEEGIIRRVVPDRWADAVAMFLGEYEAAHVACTAPFAGVPEVLRELRHHGIQLAVVTGKGRTTTGISLERIGLSGFFDAVLTGSDSGSVKSERMLELSAQWCVEPRRLAYVGDMAHDVNEARAVNIVPLAAGWAETADVLALEEARPCALFRTTGEMLSWVRSEVAPGGS